MTPMSFHDAAKWLKSQPGFEHGSGATKEELSTLVRIWPHIPPDFQEYLTTFGWVSFGPQELLGLGRDVIPQLNIVTTAEELWNGRLKYHLPRTLLAFYNGGGSWWYAFDSTRNNRVVCWALEYEEMGQPQPYDEQYDTWCDWLMRHLGSHGD